LTGYGADLLDPLLGTIEAALASPAAKVDPALETLVQRAARGRPERLLAKLSTAAPPLVEVLLRFLRPADAAAGVEAGKRLLANPDPGARLAAIRLLDAAGASDASEAALVSALDLDAVDVRIAAASAPVRHGPKNAF